MNEEVLTLGRDPLLVGILTPGRSGTPEPRPAVLLLNAGVTHRVGPHRLNVRLARLLAAQGFDAVRFDFSGLGDSTVRTDRMAPEQAVFAELKQVMDHLEQARGTRQFLLVGLCSGAAISYLAARRDPRVVGAALLNGIWHLHGADLARGEALLQRSTARHFWRIALRSSFRAKNWRKLLGGQLSPARLLRKMVTAPLALLFRGRQPAPPRTAAQDAPPTDAWQDLSELAARGVHLLHYYCEGDEGLDYFHVVLGARADQVGTLPGSRLEYLPRANHVFTLRWSQDRLVATLQEWCDQVRDAHASAPTDAGA